LFEGQHYIDPEAVLASGTLLARAHDSIGASGNDHEPFLDDPTGKLECHLVVRIIRGGAGRTEDADLASIAIAMKDTEGVTQFFYGAVDDLEVQDIQMRIVESKRPGQEFLHDRSWQVVFRAVEQETNLAEQLLVRREGAGTGLGCLHLVIHMGYFYPWRQKILSADRLLVKGTEHLCEVSPQYIIRDSLWGNHPKARSS
jgi:hypothetical protein